VWCPCSFKPTEAPYLKYLLPKPLMAAAEAVAAAADAPGGQRSQAYKAALAAFQAAALKECSRGRKQETPPEGSLAAALQQAEEEAAAEAGLPEGMVGLLRKVCVGGEGKRGGAC
jgi:hypothetical protein